MSEPTSDKPKPKRGRGGHVARAELKPGRTERPGPERRAAARAMFEGTPGATCETVAKEFGVPWSTVKRWKAEGGWKPAIRALPDLSARAGALADTFKTRMSDLGKPLDDATAAAEVARNMGTEIAVDVRAQIIDRHRKEWSAPRKIAYQAIEQGAKGDVAGAFERAKLAKITSETLAIIQSGECRAFGITAEGRGADGRTLVVIDRSAAEDAPGSGLAEGAGQLSKPAPSETDTTPSGEDEF